MEKTNDELVTVREIAARLKLEPMTIYGWSRRGKIPGKVHIGRLVRHRKVDVDAWFAAMKK